MKKTVLLIAFLLCMALILPAFVVGFAFGASPQFDETFLGEMNCKMERLEGTKQPKIIIVGGSSVAFGIRSDLMEKELGMPVVNFGLYASLGTKIMLDLSKAGISKGDVIVIAPEQDSQTLSNYFNADSAWKALDGSFEHLRHIDSENMPAMAGNLLSFAAEKYKFYSQGKKPDVSGVYTKEAFNEYGDIAYDRKTNTMFGGFDANTPISFDTDIISSDFIDYLNDYAEYARGQGARVFFSFSPMNRMALDKNCTSEDIYSYFTYLQDKLDFPVISSPEQYLMDANWFFDSNFHMNNSGAILHTKHLANDLILSLGLDRACTLETPEMPPLEEDSEAQEPVEKELFVVKEKGSGVQIVGLTEEGMKCSELEVPAEIDGKAVLALGQGAFSSASSLTRLVLNNSLTFIADGAFEGCDKLTSIVLKCDKPAQIRVGEDMLLGADNCVVYVPAGTYGAYSNDYYWAFFCDLDLVVESEA